MMYLEFTRLRSQGAVLSANVIGAGVLFRRFVRKVMIDIPEGRRRAPFHSKRKSALKSALTWIFALITASTVALHVPGKEMKRAI